jgi:iron complex outermembrane receptor protein
VLAGNNGDVEPINRPKWTLGLFAAYETKPLFGDVGLMFRADGQYKSKTTLDVNAAIDTTPQYQAAKYVNGYMLLNARIATRNLKVGGADVEFALWAKNITNRKDMSESLITSLSASAGFIDPRTFGAELSFEF